MKNRNSPTKRSSDQKRPASEQYTIGRAAFAKISAVEGMRVTAAMKADFAEFDRKGFSAAKRRAELGVKYGKQR